MQPRVFARLRILRGSAVARLVCPGFFHGAALLGIGGLLFRRKAPARVGQVLGDARGGGEDGDQEYQSQGYSITWSALARTAAGIVTPSSRAVLRLTSSSIFAGCSIGSSPGLAPFMMRSA